MTKKYSCYINEHLYFFDEEETSGLELKQLYPSNPRDSLWWCRSKTILTNRFVTVEGPDLFVSDSQHIVLGKAPLHFYTLPEHGF